MPTSVVNAATRNLPQSEIDRAERRARRFWVTAIVSLLGLQVVVGVASILLSIGDPSVAIIPNYHQAALDWDVTQRARHLTAKLGWSIQPEVSEVMPDSQRRVVRVQVLDSRGNPVPELMITAKAYHHARGAEVHQMRLQEVAPGQYQATTGLTESGLWQLQLQFEGMHGIASDNREITVK